MPALATIHPRLLPLFDLKNQFVKPMSPWFLLWSTFECSTKNTIPLGELKYLRGWRTWVWMVLIISCTIFKCSWLHRYLLYRTNQNVMALLTADICAYSHPSPLRRLSAKCLCLVRWSMHVNVPCLSVKYASIKHGFFRYSDSLLVRGAINWALISIAKHKHQGTSLKLYTVLLLTGNPKLLHDGVGVNDGFILFSHSQWFKSLGSLTF